MDQPIVGAASKPSETRSLLAVAARQLAFAGPLEVADRAQPVFGKARLRNPADAEDQRYRLRREETRGFAPAEHRKAARLVEVRGDLGQELVAGKPDRHCYPDF